MKTDVKRITEQALSLPRAARARLADRLCKSLDELTESERKEIEEAWAEEAEKRMSELEMGKVKGIPGDQALKEARARLAQVR